MKGFIQKVISRKNLSRSEAVRAFDFIMEGKASDAQIASFITALAMKGETIEEILGARDSMKKVMNKISVLNNQDLLDIVGTGGDGKNTFNVSTASAIVCAASGCRVAKHGNRGVSSNSGSADVLEKLGVNINTSPKQNIKIIEKTGLVFLFAPQHHPAMKNAARARKEIGVKTIFNILGPVTNPADAGCFMIGCYSEDLARRIAKVLASAVIKKAIVVFGNGFDEVSLCGKSRIFEVENGVVKEFDFNPVDFGFDLCRENEILVSGSDESASAIKSIFNRTDNGAKREMVVLNAGFGLYANNKAKSLDEAFDIAKKSIDSGKAEKKLSELVRVSNEFS